MAAEDGQFAATFDLTVPQLPGDNITSVVLKDPEAVTDPLLSSIEFLSVSMTQTTELTELDCGEGLQPGEVAQESDVNSGSSDEEFYK